MNATRIRSMLIASVGVACLGLGMSAPVLAQRNEMIDLQADRIEVADLDHRATFSGNVRATQGPLKIAAARAVAVYSGSAVGSGGGGPQIQQINASGSVVVNRPNETARGDYAVYDFNKRLITMIGNVTLTRQNNVVHGQRLVLNLDSSNAVLNGGAGNTTTQGGRVTGTFTVPKRDTSSNQ